mgnify:FL=1
MSDRLCSKDVADLMEKRHDNLMRTIRTDLKNLETPEKYYKEDTYTDGKGKVRECFQVSLDGCKRLSNKLKGELKEEFLIAVGLRLKNGTEGQNTKPESKPEKEYTLEEAAAELGISRRTLGRKIDAGEIQTEKREYQQILIRERSIVTESALEAYRISLEVE